MSRLHTHNPGWPDLFAYSSGIFKSAITARPAEAAEARSIESGGWHTRKNLRFLLKMFGAPSVRVFADGWEVGCKYKKSQQKI